MTKDETIHEIGRAMVNLTNLQAMVDQGAAHIDICRQLERTANFLSDLSLRVDQQLDDNYAHETLAGVI